MKKHVDQSGFTIVEALVTIFVSSLILVALASLFGTLQNLSLAQHTRAEASTVAYERLRRYVFAGAKASNFFVCDTTNSGSANTDDLIVNPNVNPITGGQQLATGTFSPGDSTSTTISESGSFRVSAVAPFGCNGTNSGTPILVTATVTYGPLNGDSVTHSDYVSY